MRKNIITVLTTMMVALFVNIQFSNAQSVISKIDPKIFPEAKAGYKKMIIEVPHSDNDANKKIVFYAGIYMEVDGCNTFNLIGTYEQKDLEGWGYNYWVFNTKGDVRNTMMACPNLPLRNLFVSASQQTVDYNGRMPIVIYVPEKYDVQFKIFKAEDETYRAAEAK